MGLTFFYEFTAPANTSASELETFLREVEHEAKSLGFNPTIVLNVPFDTPERREFSRRLHGSVWIEDERLKGIALPRSDQVRNHDPIAGSARLIPERGIVLIVTDEHGCESCFGFLQFPDHVTDLYSGILAESGFGKAWVFRNFISSPDLRYRTLVTKFQERRFLRSVKDEFVSPQ